MEANHSDLQRLIDNQYTVGDYMTKLIIPIESIMTSHIKFSTKYELQRWLVFQAPLYYKLFDDLIIFFVKKYNLK